ncbi:DUF6265 family protein [Hyphobacterium sp. HN65]|uniref:DUF6265 family protein n=1 Tax=Hyphobacterium lacteum TaxID=3116575 RepID=A0ABU7LSN0_9PROT|nr:DUF6265 family protein [Hyphobacterium sp. HN65]MEE2526925.1 DUF6265 family protein [Hyphobacterium sp. HN65]
MRFLVLPALLAVTPAVHANDLGWMEGHWRSAEGGQVSEEFWTNGDGGLYLGVNRTVIDGQARGYEFLLIAVTEAGATYCAQPGGNEAVCFPSTSVEASRVTFENPDNEFPQRIVYERVGNQLIATISDISGERFYEFGWNLVTD